MTTLTTMRPTTERLPADRPLLRAWLWLTVASSCFVFIEPAPCDILGAGLLVTAFAAGQRVPRHLGPPLLLFGLFLLGNLVASGFSRQPDASLLPFGIRSYLVLGWWLLLAALIADRPRQCWDLVWRAYIPAAVLTALAGTLAFFGLVPDNGQLVDDGRVRAFFKDPNVYGPFLVPPMILALHRLESTRRLPTAVLQTLLFGLLGLGLVLGFSRGSWLNFAVSLSVFVVLRLRSRRTVQQKRRMVGAGAALLVVAIGVVTAALNVEPVREMMEVRAKVAQDYDIQSSIGGTKSRFEVQVETLQLAMVRPLGIGAGQSEMDYNQGKAPHNLFLHTLVEGGWIGGLAFYAFIALTLLNSGSVLYAPLPLQGSYQVAFASLLGLLAQSLFVDSTHWRHFYLLLALLWGPLQVMRVSFRQR